MEKIHRDILRKKTAELCEDLEPENLLKHMTSVLKPHDEEKIRALSTRTDRVHKLLDILPKRGGRAFYCFLEALRKEQPDLADLLQREEVTFERCNSAHLRLQLSETKKELESEKEKNLKIQAENEELKRIQVEHLEKLHEQMLKTEVSLKQHFEEVLEKKTKDLASVHVPVEEEVYPNSRKCACSLNGEFWTRQILQIVEQNYRPKEDENGNTISLHNLELEKLTQELQRCQEREKTLQLECNELRDKLKALQSHSSNNQEDRSTSPIQQAASEDCTKCDILGQKYLDLQKANTEEIQRLKNATMEYKDKIKTLQNDISAQKALTEQNKENSRALDEKFKTILDEKQTELRRWKKEAEKSKKKIESAEEKLVALRQKKKHLQEENQQLLEDKEKIVESFETEQKKNEREMEGLRKIAKTVQKDCEFLATELEKWKSLPGKVLNFNKAFDRNGVIYTLMAKNPNHSLAAKRSSGVDGEPENIFNHSTGTHSCTENKERSWWQIDLGEGVLLFPNHYALRHGSQNGLSMIINWKLEGSRDGNNWKVLREHKNDRDWFRKKQGPYPYYTGSWQIEGPIEAVRYLRIYQTGKNSSGDYALYLSGIEFYGVLLHMCEGD